MSFTKKDTLVVKGVAIMMMVLHHLFRKPDLFKDFDVSFFPLSQSLAVDISSFFKICVSIFVFLSAYGLTYSLKKYSSDTVISGRQYASYLNTRLIKLMSGFWFVFIVSQIGCLFFSPERNQAYFNHGIIQGVFKFVIDFLGLENLFGTTTLNNTWWYMTLAIFIVLVVPFIARLTKRYNALFVCLMIIFLPRLLDFTREFRIGATSNCIRWMFITFLGVIFAQYNVLPRMKAFMITKNKYVSKTLKLIISLAILLIMFKVSLNFSNGFRANTYEIIDGIVPVFVIYFIYEFICDIPGLSQILMFFGKHSMNIFLFHTFIRYYWFEDFTYSFHNWLVIFAVLFGISLGISIVIEFVKKLIRYDKLTAKTCSFVEKKFSK